MISARPDRTPEILRLWAAGKNPAEIGRDLRIPEAVVARIIREDREARRAKLAGAA